MFKTEPHLHLSEVSACSSLSAEEMVRLYNDAGYKTIFVTDHFVSFYFDKFGDIPWEDKVTIFFSGFYRAKKVGEKYGMNVLPAIEIMFDGCYNHYLVYGATKEFLSAHPDICQMKVEEFYKLAKENDMFVIQAHPHREEICFPTPNCVDAFEIYNSSPKHRDFSERSEKVASEYGLYVTAGSDSHYACDVGLAGVISENEIKTVKDYIDLVKSGKFEIIRGGVK